MASDYVHGKSSYISDAYILDLVTLRWRKLDVSETGIESKLKTIAGGQGLPSGRYLGGIVFIPSERLRARHDQNYRELYDEQVVSSHANYAGAISDGVMVFGGLNGATGAFQGGEHGGLLNDMYVLRLANVSSASGRSQQHLYRERNCQWRYSNQSSGVTAFNTKQCATGGYFQNCDLRDLLLLAWCDPAFYSQTIR